jgi:hypothetical protein
MDNDLRLEVPRRRGRRNYGGDRERMRTLRDDGLRAVRGHHALDEVLRVARA